MKGTTEYVTKTTENRTYSPKRQAGIYPLNNLYSYLDVFVAIYLLMQACLSEYGFTQVELLTSCQTFIDWGGTLGN